MVDATIATVKVISVQQFEELLYLRCSPVVHFWAPWPPQYDQMNSVMTGLAKEYLQVLFVKLEALSEVSQKYEIICFSRILKKKY